MGCVSFTNKIPPVAFISPFLPDTSSPFSSRVILRHHAHKGANREKKNRLTCLPASKFKPPGIHVSVIVVKVPPPALV